MQEEKITRNLEDMMNSAKVMATAAYNLLMGNVE